jgi:hypothetical protein
MPSTLQQQMVADASSGGVFFQGNGQGFDVEVTHYPEGDLAAPEPLDAIVDRDLEDHGGAGDGEGLQFDTRKAVKLRRNAVLSLPISATITESSGTETKKCSLFDFDSYRWRAVRILSRDAALQDVLVTRLDKLVTRGVSR